MLASTQRGSQPCTAAQRPPVHNEGTITVPHVALRALGVVRAGDLQQRVARRYHTVLGPATARAPTAAGERCLERRIQRAAVGLGVDAVRHAAGDGQALPAELGGEIPGVLPATGRRVATADNGQLGLPQRVGVAPDEQCGRRRGDVTQERGVAFVTPGQQVVLRLRQPGEVLLEPRGVGVGKGFDRLVLQAGLPQAGRGRPHQLAGAAEGIDQGNKPRAPESGGAQCNEPMFEIVDSDPRSVAGAAVTQRRGLRSRVRVPQDVEFLYDPVASHHHAVADEVEGAEDHHDAVVHFRQADLGVLGETALAVPDLIGDLVALAERGAEVVRGVVAAGASGAMAGDGIVWQDEPREGKIKLLADRDGLFTVNTSALAAFNMVDEVMCATLHSHTLVRKGELVAATRAIPLVMKGAPIERAAAIAQQNGATLAVKALLPAKVGLIITGNEVYHGLIEDRFDPILSEKVTALGLQDQLLQIQPPKDWSTSRDGGPRKRVVEELKV